MREHPILFKAEMVRAILAGQKTQTRRTNLKTKYAVGDRLWVKETTVNVEVHGFVGPVYAESEEGHAYREWGLGPDPVEVEPEDLKLRSALFMSRKMSRITLEVTAVREERLQDINETDCIAEGVSGIPYMLPGDKAPFLMESMAECRYRSLWESINGPGSWDENPTVKVITFKRLTPQ